MTFDLPSNRTVAGIGDKTIMIKTTGHEKTHFSFVLSLMADGTKLKSIIIFKSKMLLKSMKFPAGVIVHAHVKGWMDENETVDRLENV